MFNNLFHASTNKNLKVIKPQNTLSNDAYIGNYVFATSSKVLAAMYLTTRDVPTIMHYESEKPVIMIMANPREYAKNDVGGAIYTLPAGSFTTTPQEGLEDSEYVSAKEVIPLSKNVYGSSIEAMESMSITVKFINRKRFNELSSKSI